MSAEWRHGFCDAVFDRPSDSPWKNAGWKAKRKNEQYLRGYFYGKETRVKL